MRKRFSVGGSCPGTFARPQPVWYRLNGRSAQSVVPGEHFGLGLLQFGKVLLDRFSNLQMQLLARAFQQGFVSGLLYQRMLEVVLGGLWAATPQQQAGIAKSGQRLPELFFVEVRNSRKQPVIELAADHRGNLRQAFGRGEMVQPRRQRIAQSGWHGDG